MQYLLEVKSISSSYGKQLAINGASINLEKGEIGCLIGPSGCGKTTLLRTIAGFQDILSGEILIEGRKVATLGFSVSPEKRGVGMVFQDYALFPHLNVQANVAFGLDNMKKLERKRRIIDLLRLIDLEEVKYKYPHELSGGEQQRIALARSLAPRPHLLLLDEPFSNLDVNMRERLSVEVHKIIKQQNATALVVTHNQHEAFAMADKIGVISNGCILQWDNAYNIYHRPAGSAVASFVGEGVLLQGRVIDNHLVECGLGVLEGSFSSNCPIGSTTDILIRPEDIVQKDDSSLRATVIKKTFRGPNIIYTLRLSSGDIILALFPSHYRHEVGEEIGIKPEVKDIVLFRRDQEDMGCLPKIDINYTSLIEEDCIKGINAV